MTDRLENLVLPDGRTVRATHKDVEGGVWSVEVVDAAGERRDPYLARDLRRALISAVVIAHHPLLPWVFEAATQLTGRDTSLGRRFACPCCEFLTLTELPPGTHAICPVCGWQDDEVQFNNPDREGGANRASLRQARENYLRWGASELRRRPHVRAPRPQEHP